MRNTTWRYPLPWPSELDEALELRARLTIEGMVHKDYKSRSACVEGCRLVLPSSLKFSLALERHQYNATQKESRATTPVRVRESSDSSYALMADDVRHGREL